MLKFLKKILGKELNKKTLIPEGFEDHVDFNTNVEHEYKNKIIDYFILNGFDLIKTPMIEFYENNSDNCLFIETRKNKPKLFIRDDITPQIIRIASSRFKNKKRPIKLCYYGEVVRKQGSMLRPERQFLQIGAECIGENSFLADVEMMELAYTSLNLVGIKQITIEVSSRIFYDKFISTVKKFYNKEEIIRLIKLKDLDSLIKILNKKDHKYIKNLFACTGNYKNKKSNLKKLAIDKFTANEILNIENIINSFLNRNKNVNIFLDLCEIDLKNYHSGVRFTFFGNNVRGEIARGGRYYIPSSNKKNVATGFTCYMDSILRASSLKVVKNKIFVPFNVSKNRINELIKKGYSIFKYTGNQQYSKKMAKEYNCQFYLLNNNIKKI